MENAKRERSIVSKCPDDLGNIIDAVNLLPNDLDKFERELIEVDRPYFDPYKFRELVPIELEEQIKRPGLPFTFPNLQFRLRRLVNEKRILKDIILAFQTWHVDFDRQGQTIIPKQWGLETDDVNLNNQLTLRPSFTLTRPPSAFNFRDDTSLELLSFRVLEILTRDKLPVERIRECRVCHKIFWAKRKESPTCSEGCLRTDNARRTRIKKLISEFGEMTIKLKKLEAGKRHGLIPGHVDRMRKLRSKIEVRARKYGLTQFTNSLFRSSVID